MAIIRIAWKILVGVKDALVMLLLILFFGALAILLSSRPNGAAVVDGPLVLAIDGTISEQPAAIDPLTTLLSGAAPVQEYAARDIIHALDVAARDDRVTSVVLDLDRFLGGGQATLADIGERLDAVRAAGKLVHAYAAVYTNDGYQLAAHADKIWMDPMGAMVIAPRGGSNLYFADALERYGVNVHVYRVGRYKSAVEPFLTNRQSPAAAEDARALYGALWAAWRGEVARLRPKAQIDALVERPAELLEGTNGDAARLALSLGIVDAIATPRQFADAVSGDAERTNPAEVAGTQFTDYLSAIGGPAQDGVPIAVITVAGNIVDGEGGSGSAAGDTVSELIHGAIVEDVPAIVLRIDSPGGSVPASEQIRRALVDAKASGIPIVVSMANVAASGGYWISTPADRVFAEPATITGSIGVFGLLPTFEGALAQFGVNADGVKLSPLSGQPDLIGGTSAEFDRSAQLLVDNIYGRFLGLVSEARSLPVERVDEIAQGRVWAGLPARQIGLVDDMGGLDDALAYAAKLAKLNEGEWHARYYAPQPGWFGALLSAEEGGARTSAPQDGFSVMQASAKAQQRAALSNLKLLFQAEGAQALCLVCVDAMPPGGQAEDDGLFARLLGRAAIGR